ncbi:MAG: hypothetical protein FWG90_04630 [Oscillospiraceae bacterium]|nr:hypothetical protein [Oscillospiraceae bacterium]
MATKIDYIVLFKPLEKLIKNPKISAEEKLKMIEEVIDDILKQAEKEN